MEREAGHDIEAKHELRMYYVQSIMSGTGSMKANMTRYLTTKALCFGLQRGAVHNPMISVSCGKCEDRRACTHTHTHERLLTRSKELLLKERGLLSLFSTRWRTAMRMRRERCYELSCKRSEKQPAWDSWGRLGKSFYHSRPLFSRCAIPHLSGKSGGTFLPRREGGRTGCPLRPLPSLSSLELRVGTAHGAILLPLSPKEMQCWKPDPVFWHTEPCTVMASPGSLRL